MDVTTAQDLDAMTPAGRAEAVEAGFVTDPATLPTSVQEHRRARDTERDLRANRAS